MAWTDIPINKITFGLSSGSAPGATVNVAAADLLLCRFKLIGPDTLVVDVRVKKAFFTPNTAAVAGITMELAIPFNSIFFPALGAPSVFMDGGQTYSNDCDICLDPGRLSYVAGVIAVLNEQNHKIVLLVRNLAGMNLNPTPSGARRRRILRSDHVRGHTEADARQDCCLDAQDCECRAHDHARTPAGLRFESS